MFVFLPMKASSGGWLITLAHRHSNSSLICHCGSCCLVDSRWAVGLSDDVSCITAAATLSCPAHQFKLLPSGQRNIIFPSAGLMDMCAHWSTGYHGIFMLAVFFIFFFYLIVLCSFIVKSHNQKEITTWWAMKDAMMSLVLITHNAIEPEMFQCAAVVYSVHLWTDGTLSCRLQLKCGSSILSTSSRHRFQSAGHAAIFFFFCITNQLPLQMDGLKEREV